MANRKLNALARITSFMDLNKQIIIINSFLTKLTGYVNVVYNLSIIINNVGLKNHSIKKLLKYTNACN